MTKYLVVVLAGAIVGAATVEVLNKKVPGWYEKTQDKIKNSYNAAKEAFKAGYQAQKA